MRVAAARLLRKAVTDALHDRSLNEESHPVVGTLRM
jgi:hypothetical protein